MHVRPKCVEHMCMYLYADMHTPDSTGTTAALHLMASDIVSGRQTLIVQSCTWWFWTLRVSCKS